MGAKFTVRVAAVVVTLPDALVNTAWYWFPLMDAVVLVIVSVAELAPATSLNAPPFVLTCHCTVGAGLPLAAAVKLAVCPSVTV